MFKKWGACRFAQRIPPEIQPVSSFTFSNSRRALKPWDRCMTVLNWFNTSSRWSKNGCLTILGTKISLEHLGLFLYAHLTNSLVLCNKHKHIFKSRRKLEEVWLPHTAVNNTFFAISSFFQSQWLGLSVLHSTLSFICPALYNLSYCNEENECICSQLTVKGAIIFIFKHTLLPDWLLFCTNVRDFSIQILALFQNN